jgi:uncharacterized protein
MPTRETAPLGAPCWIDLGTSDVDGAQSFYGELFGWTAESQGPDYGGYVIFSKDGLQVAGCMATQQPGLPDSWSVYLASADAAATVDSAVAHGSAVYVPAMDVMALGRMAFVADAGQAAIGIWQPGDHKGFGVIGEPGSPVWFELHTRDYDASVQFYRDVFAWKTDVVADESEFRYTIMGEGDEQLAGIMDASANLAEGVPAHWLVYFGVEDTDAAMSKAVLLGGSIVLEAADSPHGRVGQLADPTGAMFRVIANP